MPKQVRTSTLTDPKKRREYWVAELAKISGTFGDASTSMIEELRAEITREGPMSVLEHLRSCGAMPEQYGHDSSEEKLYSKYTDAVVSESLNAIGLRSMILTARADSADVQARGSNYSLVADAKAFRLSRTAKNQKDFKVQAMDDWRGDLDHAAVVCPIYQLPSRTSQIYKQAIERNVCIISYSHLAALVGLSMRKGAAIAEQALRDLLKSIEIMHPSKNAVDYWSVVNRALIASLSGDEDLWKSEKMASIEALDMLRKESLSYLRSERNRLLALSHQQALNELIRLAGLDSRITQVEHVEHGNLLGE